MSDKDVFSSQVGEDEFAMRSVNYLEALSKDPGT